MKLGSTRDPRPSVTRLCQVPRASEIARPTIGGTMSERAFCSRRETTTDSRARCASGKTKKL
jgi:hypothetical protein